jgi:hypothetical protein
MDSAATLYQDGSMEGGEWWQVFKVWGSLESLEEVARTVADVAIWQGLASATPQHFPTLAYVSVSTHKIFSFNDSVYMATWVGHTSKKLLPPLLHMPQKERSAP